MRNRFKNRSSSNKKIKWKNRRNRNNLNQTKPNKTMEREMTPSQKEFMKYSFLVFQNFFGSEKIEDQDEAWEVTKSQLVEKMNIDPVLAPVFIRLCFEMFTKALKTS
jgi:hypothetical protein